MAAIKCPHCGVENPEGGAFCESCGKALPSGAAGGPRVVSGDAIATTGAGQTVQAAQLRKQTREAVIALFAVGVLQALGGALLYFILKDAREVDPNVPTVVLTMSLVLAAIYGALGFWARKSPLPATIVGLVLYLSLIGVSAVIDPATIGQGIIIKLLIIVALAKGVQAGVKYRQLREEMAKTGTAPLA